METLIDGLTFPRGIAVGEELYVAELGDLACEEDYPECKGDEVADDPAVGEARILAESRGRVLAFPLSGGEARVLLENLPVVSSEHGLNDLELGPDSMLHLSIGNVGALLTRPDLMPEHPNRHLLGTVIRVHPDTGAYDVYATGLRNMYGLLWHDGELAPAPSPDGSAPRG